MEQERIPADREPGQQVARTCLSVREAAMRRRPAAEDALRQGNILCRSVPRRDAVWMKPAELGVAGEHGGAAQALVVRIASQEPQEVLVAAEIVIHQSQVGGCLLY